MNRYLHGIHDPDGAELMADKPGWIVFTEAIGCDPKDTSGRSYHAWTSRGFGVIVRLNNGYYSHSSYPGTIPTPDKYDEFSVRCANFVAASDGCEIVIIGNETNMIAETPNRGGILPADYARCYRMCREAIHRVKSQCQVLVAGCAPWNQQSGDWLGYWRAVLSNVGEECDGLAIHTYSHGTDPSLITSEEMIHGWHWHFRVYQDQLAVLPAILYGLPVFITETDQDDAWADTNSGWVQEAYAEIDRWNEMNAPAIHALCLFRSLPGDRWSFADKNGVKADFRAAVERGYQAPIMNLPQPPWEPDVPPFEPEPEPPPLLPPEPLKWDPRLTARGCTLQHALMPSDVAPLVTVGRWFDREQAEGRISVYVRLLDELRRLVTGVPVTWFWSSGSETKLTERKSDPWLESKGLGREYSCDFAMYEPAPSYGVKIEGDYRGDIIDGCGLGSIEQPDYKIHTAYFFEWQLTPAGITEPVPPILPPIPPVQGEELTHPLPGAVITQNFYEESDAYKQYGFTAHNGCDLGGRALRTPVRSIASGIVAYSDFDAGYGHYVRADYRDLGCYVMYCHLDEPGAPVGTRLQAGDTVGLLGSSGNSSGPHCHVEVRLQNKDGTYREDTPMSKGRCDPRTFLIMHNLKL